LTARPPTSNKTARRLMSRERIMAVTEAAGLVGHRVQQLATPTALYRPRQPVLLLLLLCC